MKILKIILSRIVIILLAIAMEIMIILSIFKWAGRYATVIEVILRIIGTFVIIGIIRRSKSIASDLTWILFIELLPVPGTLMYVLMGGRALLSRTFRDLKASAEDSARYYPKSDIICDEVKTFEPGYAGLFRYISKTLGFSFYREQGCDYYPLGELGYPRMLEELEKAEKFIFLEYFIIGEGVMWESILEILERKAKEGLDVRVIYDDMGSFFTLPGTYTEKMEARGIKCLSFNRVHPVLNTLMNRRDHRKIMVIDGKVAFSGGINIADEYINVKKRFGQWKDNIIRISGDAVWSMTVMFLTHWNALRKEDDDFFRFRAYTDEPAGKGYLAPFSDTPLDDDRASQDIYQGIMNQAQKYCWISTPYLIIDNELMNTITFTAKRGVDVRIITPGIPDKRLVWRITRSYYAPLIEAGVRVFEYEPGFLHSKAVVSDDKAATVGTVNLDYRSMYFQFENGIYLYRCRAVSDVKKDFEDSLEKCREVSLEDCRLSVAEDFAISVLRLFAPLL